VVDSFHHLHHTNLGFGGVAELIVLWLNSLFCNICFCLACHCASFWHWVTLSLSLLCYTSWILAWLVGLWLRPQCQKKLDVVCAAGPAVMVVVHWWKVAVVILVHLVSFLAPFLPLVSPEGLCLGAVTAWPSSCSCSWFC
jgi:hypothetical protein